MAHSVGLRPTLKDFRHLKIAIILTGLCGTLRSSGSQLLIGGEAAFRRFER